MRDGNSRLKMTFKWSFVFSVLLIWTIFVFQAAITGGAIFEPKTNAPIFIETPEGVIKKATFDELTDFLFKHDFNLEYLMNDSVIEDRCSVRAKYGNSIVDGENLGNKNKISFYSSLENGKGTITTSGGGNRLTAKFDKIKILEKDSGILKFEIAGKGRFNREKFEILDGTLIFDKLNNKVTISSNQEVQFLIENADVTFSKGCSLVEKEYWILIDQGELQEQREIEEVRELLNQNPQFNDNYERFQKLFKEFWWVAITSPGLVS